MIYDIITIGNGLIGSAATRYLSAAGLRVAGIGPAEPANWKSHQGVFASHYDQGRITRILDPDYVWALLGQRALAAYADIEQRSGIRFHYITGGLRLSATPTATDDRLALAEQHGRTLGADFVRQSQPELTATFPFLRFPESTVALWEQGQAGYINPRSLVQAQLTIAAEQGAQIIRETVIAIDKTNGQWEVRTDAGEIYQTAQVLIAAGAYTNQLLSHKLSLRPREATILLAEIHESEAERLHAMPTLIYRLLPHATLYSIYCLPPIRYPDGKIYVKLGGTFHDPGWFESPDDLQVWFHSDGHLDRADALKDVLLSFIPNLQAVSFHSRPCVTTYPSHDHPFIGELEAGLFVAAGGCGSAAKSSNEIGRIAALLVEKGEWVYDVDAAVFRTL